MESTMNPYQERQILEMIQGSNGSVRSIQHISQYCIERATNPYNKINEVDIAKFFQSIVKSGKMIETKLIVVRVMTEIIAGKHKNAFLKHFAPRMLLAITLNRRELQSNPQTLRALAALLQKWKNQKFFCDTFYEKILQQVGPQLMENMQYQIAQTKFVKYKKLFLTCYRDVNNNRSTAKMFKECIKSCKLTKSVQQLTTKHSTLTSENKLTNTEAKIMLQTSQILIDQHVQALELFKDSVELVKYLFEEQAKYLSITNADLQKQQTS